MEHLSGSLFWIALFGYLAVTEWVDARGKSSRKQTAYDAQKMLLDRFQSIEELNRFLATEAGTKFVESLSDGQGAKAGRLGPLPVLVALLILGAVGVSLGFAFYLLATLNHQPDFMAPAIVVTVPSLGLIAGAAIGYLRMRRKESRTSESGTRA